jgi:hypothetical protein
MSQQHLAGFLADVGQANWFLRRERSSFLCLSWGTVSSLANLLTHLANTVNNPQPFLTVNAARQRCADPNDPRLTKYVPAIERLVAVWGRGNHAYPHAGAHNNFKAHVQTVPLNLRPPFTELWDFQADPIGFNMSLGAAYLHRAMVNGQTFDITARSLLLKAGLTVPVAVQHDNGYIAKLGLVQAHLDRMANSTVLDVGCGAAIFGSEMAVLYNSTTAGIDQDDQHIPAAIGEGQRRYVKSMLFLKMLKDMGQLQRADLPVGAATLIDRIIASLPAILNHYGNVNNLPAQGDIFHLGASALQLRPQGWDHVVTMNLLGYFDRPNQNAAVENLCMVTTSRRLSHVYVFSGLGLLRPLLYTRRTVTDVNLNARIDEKDERTHHISLPAEVAVEADEDYHPLMGGEEIELGSMR